MRSRRAARWRYGPNLRHMLVITIFAPNTVHTRVLIRIPKNFLNFFQKPLDKYVPMWYNVSCQEGQDLSTSTKKNFKNPLTKDGQRDIIKPS